MTAQLYLPKAWKVCWRVLPVRTEIPPAKPKSAAFWVNTGLSISSMLRHRNSLAGSGAIGIGEITSIPTAPAIAEAYYRYDGERRTALPLSNTPYSKK